MADGDAQASGRIPGAAELGPADSRAVWPAKYAAPPVTGRDDLHKRFLTPLFLTPLFPLYPDPFILEKAHDPGAPGWGRAHLGSPGWYEIACPPIFDFLVYRKPKVHSC